MSGRKFKLIRRKNEERKRHGKMGGALTISISRETVNNIITSFKLAYYYLFQPLSSFQARTSHFYISIHQLVWVALGLLAVLSLPQSWTIDTMRPLHPLIERSKCSFIDDLFLPSGSSIRHNNCQLLQLIDNQALHCSECILYRTSLTVKTARIENWNSDTTPSSYAC